jgi:hypothetical protein
MLFFEIHEPYYALIKAEDKETAKLEYEAAVAFLEDEDGAIEEVDKDYALATFSQSKDEEGELLDVSEILQEFKDENRSVLLIDGTLI